MTDMAGGVGLLGTPEDSVPVKCEGLVPERWFMLGEFDRFVATASSIDRRTPTDLLRCLGWHCGGLSGASGWAAVNCGDLSAVVVVGTLGTHADNRLADEAVRRSRQTRTSAATAFVVCGDWWRVVSVDSSEEAASLYVNALDADPQFLGMALGPHGLPDPDVLASARSEAARYGSTAERLQDNVCLKALPRLAEAFGVEALDNGQEFSVQDAYEAALRFVFRVLFVVHAEDCDLLPFRRNNDYAERSMTRLVERLAAEPGWNRDDRRGLELINWTNELWDTINFGDDSKGVPEYNGGLFDAHHDKPSELIARSRAADAHVAYVLRQMLVEEDPRGQQRKVDLRALTVRDFGTINESMLEYTLREEAAEDDGSRAVLGELNSARKESGAYYTPQFAVDWVLDHTLKPALDEHLDRVRDIYDRDGDEKAGVALLDFSVIDPACGSGHFLVSACDRIAERFKHFLAERPIEWIHARLAELRTAATDAMRHDPGGLAKLSNDNLLLRTVASHCVYGVDINPLSAELARLSLWIRTFVPGLPLQELNSQIVVGNLLLTVSDADASKHIAALLKKGQPQLEGIGPRRAAAVREYEASRLNLQRDKQEIEKVRRHRQDAQERMGPRAHQLNAALAVACGLAGPTPVRRRSGLTPVVLAAGSEEDLSALMAHADEENPEDGHPAVHVYKRLRALDPHRRKPTHPQIEFPHIYSPRPPVWCPPRVRLCGRQPPVGEGEGRREDLVGPAPAWRQGARSGGAQTEGAHIEGRAARSSD